MTNLIGLGNIDFKDSVPVGGFDAIMLHSLRKIEGAGEFPCESLYPVVFYPILGLFKPSLPAQG